MMSELSPTTRRSSSCRPPPHRGVYRTGRRIDCGGKAARAENACTFADAESCPNATRKSSISRYDVHFMRRRHCHVGQWRGVISLRSALSPPGRCQMSAQRHLQKQFLALVVNELAISFFILCGNDSQQLLPPAVSGSGPIYAFLNVCGKLDQGAWRLRM